MQASRERDEQHIRQGSNVQKQASEREEEKTNKN